MSDALPSMHTAQDAEKENVMSIKELKQAKKEAMMSIANGEINVVDGVILLNEISNSLIVALELEAARQMIESEKRAS